MPKPPVIRESKLETDIWEYAEATGWWAAKFTSPGKRAVPDRLFIRKGVHLFGEIKRPGEEPTRQQELRHKKMRAHGAIVRLWDNFDDAKSDLDFF